MTNIDQSGRNSLGKEESKYKVGRHLITSNRRTEISDCSALTKQGFYLFFLIRSPGAGGPWLGKHPHNASESQLLLSFCHPSVCLSSGVLPNDCEFTFPSLAPTTHSILEEEVPSLFASESVFGVWKGMLSPKTSFCI